jgi:hypothetical protein
MGNSLENIFLCIHMHYQVQMYDMSISQLAFSEGESKEHLLSSTLLKTITIKSSMGFSHSNTL